MRFRLASAPNITGTLMINGSDGGSSCNGCFSGTSGRGWGWGHSGIDSGGYAGGNLNASRSSDTYGRTSKLYPDHYSCKWYIKYR